jgi:microcystin-dependent protein
MFSDRPARTSRAIQLDTLVGQWATLGFKDDPPNAVLALSEDSSQEMAAVEISAPRREGGTVTFTLGRLRGGADEQGIFDRLRQNTAGGKEARLGAHFVFIDPSGPDAPQSSDGSASQGCGTTGDLEFTAAFNVPDDEVVQYQALSRDDAPDLYAMVGDQYGDTGDPGTFAVPGVGALEVGTYIASDTLRARVCAKGSAPTKAPDPTAVADGPGGCLIGELRASGVLYDHAGWLTADGRELNVADYKELYKRVGARFGGDGDKTFALPDYQLPKVENPSPDAAQPKTRICVHGEAWPPGENGQTPAASDCALGVVRLFAGDDLPGGYLSPQGQRLQIQQNPALFQAIGNFISNTIFQLPSVDSPKKGLQWGLCGFGYFAPPWDNDAGTPPGGRSPAPLTTGTLNQSPPKPCGAYDGGPTKTLDIGFPDAAFDYGDFDTPKNYVPPAFQSPGVSDETNNFQVVPYSGTCPEGRRPVLLRGDGYELTLTPGTDGGMIGTYHVWVTDDVFVYAATWSLVFDDGSDSKGTITSLSLDTYGTRSRDVPFQLSLGYKDLISGAGQG